MKYYCSFPNCSYETDSRSKIDFHHITPKEIDPNSKVLLSLCKTHHSLIYHPLAKHGQHSILTENCLEILGKYKSTIGESIHYKKPDGTKFFWFPKTKEIWKD